MKLYILYILSISVVSPISKYLVILTSRNFSLSSLDDAIQSSASPVSARAFKALDFQLISRFEYSVLSIFITLSCGVLIWAWILSSNERSIRSIDSLKSRASTFLFLFLWLLIEELLEDVVIDCDIAGSPEGADISISSSSLSSCGILVLLISASSSSSIEEASLPVAEMPTNRELQRSA